MLQGCQVSSPGSYFLSRCGIILASTLGISNCSVDELVAFIPFCSTHSEHNILELVFQYLSTESESYCHHSFTSF